MTTRLSGRFAASVLAIGLLLAPAALTAQSEGTARIRGVVFDSTTMAPLAGARVAVLGTGVTGQTDADGRFTLSDVPAGTHTVSFFHDRLQVLGVSPPSRQVDFTSGSTQDVQLFVPSEATLLMGWCLAEQPGSGYAAVAGVVTDSLTGVPMPHALVTATPVTRLPGIQPLETRTDDAGYFRMCAVRGDIDVRLQAHFGMNSGRTEELYMKAGSAQIQDLMLLMSAPGTLVGYVRDYATGDPVAGAKIEVIGTGDATLSDDTGRFLLDDLPPGRHLVSTDHIAYREHVDSVTVFSQETVDIEIRMATEAVEVEGLVVTARTRFGETRSLAGNAKRMDYISREEIDAILPRVTATADLLRAMNTPGLRIREVYQVDQLTGVMVPGLCIEVSRRSGGEGCKPAAVAINDVLVLFPDQVLQNLDPTTIDRIEILSPTDAQFQFGADAGNGALMIYTR